MACRAISKSPRAPPTASSWACAIAVYPIEGVQFHPESVLTADGKRLIKNFLNLG